MELLYDENLLPRILMTITAIALTIGPAVADFNKTHATNPLWPPHARFHVVWQVITNSSLCLMILYILWTPLGAGLRKLLRGAREEREGGETGESEALPLVTDRPLVLQAGFSYKF